MKFLIGFVTFILCAAILAFGGYQTVMESDFEKMVDDFEFAIENTPVIPELPDNGNAGDNTGKPGDNTGNSGDNTGNAGDNTGNAGDNTGNSGDNTGNAGDNAGNDGDNTGDNTGNAGDNTGNDGDNTGNEGGNDEENNDNNVTDGGAIGVVGGVLDSAANNFNQATADVTQSLIQNQIEQNVDTSTEAGQTAANAASSVVENIYNEFNKIEEKGQESGKTAEEKAEERQQVVEETKKGLEGAETLLGAAQGEEVSSEDLGEAIGKIADSDVMVNVGNDILEDEATKESVREQINLMPEEQKQEITDTLKEKYEDKLAEDPEQAENLKNLAGSFGFDVSAWMNSDELPEGFPFQ